LRYDGGLNWTTTKIPLWQIDCESYRKAGQPFELREVTTPEHEQFVQVFAARYDLQITREGYASNVCTNRMLGGMTPL
jgi:hypothetical protein